MKLFVLILAILSTGHSLKVLVCMPGSIKSLSYLFGNLANEIASAGHDVTLLTAHPIKNPSTNLQIVEVGKNIAQVWNEMNVFKIHSIFDWAKQFKEIVKEGISEVWESPKFGEIFENRRDLDIILVASYYSEMLFPLLMDSNAQLVQLITPGIEAVSLSRNGNWVNPAVVPSLLLNYDDEMSFWERVLNLPSSILFFYIQYTLTNFEVEETQKFVPNYTDATRYYDRVALSFINGHFAMDGPVPLLPNQVEIGTINIKEPKPLPKDLEEFMNNSGDAGVIYFSLGSFAKPSDIPMSAKLSFIEAFKRIPQRIVWKFDEKDIDLPPNVITRNWLPQQDVLNHPKTKVFISHCGNQGTQEAKYFGVPILGVPIAFDQPRNAARMERKGLAIVLTWDEITTEKIINYLNKLVNDTSYKEKISQVSRLLQDQKESPAKRAVWWIEYIARHKGAPQLEYAGKRLHFLQYILVDVMLFWVILISAIIFAFIKCIKWLCFSDKRSKMKKVKKS